MRSAPPCGKHSWKEGGLCRFRKSLTIFSAPDEGAERQKSLCLENGGVLWGGSTVGRGLSGPVEKAQFEELADEAVRGSGATAYRHSHCPPGEAERAEERGAREAAQGRRERLVRR